MAPKLIFNKPLNPITVNNSTFRMYLNDTGQWIPLTVTLSANGLEVTLTPQIPLLPNTRYRYFEACCGYQDQDGNSGNLSTFYFYTSGGAVTTGPTVTVSPVNSATGIPLNAQVIASVSARRRSHQWTQNSIQLLERRNSGGGNREPDQQPDAQLCAHQRVAGDTTYTVNVDGFTDANGNAVTPSSTTFTTGGAASTGGLTFTRLEYSNNATASPPRSRSS